MSKANPYLGVSWHVRLGKWRVKIRVGSDRHLSLGYYSDPAEGARVWDFVTRLLRGRDATQNFPGETVSAEKAKELAQLLVAKGVMTPAGMCQALAPERGAIGKPIDN